MGRASILFHLDAFAACHYDFLKMATDEGCNLRRKSGSSEKPQ